MIDQLTPEQRAVIEAWSGYDGGSGATVSKAALIGAVGSLLASHDARGERIEALSKALRQARGWVVTCSESATARSDLALIDCALAQSPSAPQGEGEDAMEEQGLDAFRCDVCGQRNELCDCTASPKEPDYYPDRFEDQNIETERAASEGWHGYTNHQLEQMAANVPLPTDVAALVEETRAALNAAHDAFDRLTAALEQSARRVGGPSVSEYSIARIIAPGCNWDNERPGPYKAMVLAKAQEILSLFPAARPDRGEGET